jgi:hypothetical protein
LTQQGFCGDSARFDYLELHAIERPGWNQVFTFCVEACNEDGLRARLHGVVRDDERRGMDIYLGTSQRDQSRVAEEWSVGLITCSRKPWNNVTRLLLVVFGVVVALATLGAVLSASQFYAD